MWELGALRTSLLNLFVFINILQETVKLRTTVAQNKECPLM